MAGLYVKGLRRTSASSQHGRTGEVAVHSLAMLGAIACCFRLVFQTPYDALVPSRSTRSPSFSQRVTSAISTTAGMPNFRATIAEWDNR